MDSIEPNQSSNTLDLTSSPLLPAAQRWSHDPETSKWFLHERSNRLLHDGFKNPVPDTPTIHYLTAKARNALRAERISTVYTMPEYPETSHNGVAYCVNITGMAPELVRQLHLDVQYGKNNRSTSHNQSTTSFWLGGVDVQRSTWCCSGVRACQYASNNIKKPHTKWDSSDWELRRRETHHTQRIWQLEYGIDKGQQKTLDFYWACWTDFQKSTHCLGTTDCNGIMELAMVDNASFSGNPSWAIRCSVGRGTHLYWSHYWAPINPLHNINIELLKDLIQNGYKGHIQHCFPTFSVKSRKTNCGIAHPQGYGTLNKISCNVQFDFIVPNDLQRTPYVIFCSTGVHSHQPPPPQKTPVELLNGLISVIKRLSTPSLTMSQLLISNELRTWVNSLGKRSLSEIHASFASTSRISALIRTEQLLVWGAGRDWAGVVRESQLEVPSQKYIRYIYNDGPNALIICFTDKMAQQLVQRDSFELDMSFKRVAGSFNEVVFAAYDETFNQLLVVTYGRVFINSETRVAYFHLFTMFWRQIELALPRAQKVRWHHLHSSGIKAIVTDMCSKQASGLGDYLSSIDEEHRPWDWHIQRLLIYCSVHFKRGIDSSYWKDTPYADLMKEILKLPSQSAIIDLCDCLRRDQPLMADWLNHKLCPWIISGLNKSYWRGDPNIWEQIRRHSNAVEASHHKSNALGTGLSLLGAIQNSRVLDNRDWDQIEAQDLYGISRQYQGTSSIERFRHAIRKNTQKREERRKEAVLQARQELLLENSIPSSQPIATVNGTKKRKRGPRPQVSSSGVVRRRIDYEANINSLPVETGHLSTQQSSVVDSVSVVESVYTPFSFGLSSGVPQTRRSL